VTRSSEWAPSFRFSNQNFERISHLPHARYMPRPPHPKISYHADFLWWGVVSPCQSSNLEDHLLSAVRDCLLNIFAATIHIWRPSPPSATWGHVMQWWKWKRTHLKCRNTIAETYPKYKIYYDKHI
jgi:hypothetical protein